MLVSGGNGQIDFDGKRVKIMRKGLLAFATQGFKGEKVIPISNIISVQFKLPGLLANGYIQFATAGGEGTKGIQEAVSDENTVFFEKKDIEQFSNLKNAIESAMESLSSNQAQASSTPSVADEILKFKQLLDQGVLSEQEFQEAKKKLLG
jgi:hypothetical protein